MKEELYLWIRNLAVFYIFFTAVLNLIPDQKYEKYVRFFMGLLLMIMPIAIYLSSMLVIMDLRTSQKDIVSDSSPLCQWVGISVRRNSGNQLEI